MTGTTTIPVESALARDLAVVLATPPPPLSAVDPDERLVQHVALQLIDDNPDNPRDDVGDVSDLAQSIAQGGLLQPVLLVPKPVWRAGADQLPDPADTGRYVLIHGHRRRAACRLLELDHIDAIVKPTYVGAHGQIAMIVENFHREDLNPLQEARAFAKLHELGLEQDAIATRVGCSQSHVSKRLGLLELPAETQALVLDKTLTIADALELRPVADDPKAIATAVSRRNAYGGVKGAVSEALKAREDADAARRVANDLKAQGIRHVKAPDHFVYNGKVVKLDELIRAKRTTKAKHAKLKCHAVAVHQRTGGWSFGAKAGDTVLVCTDPKSHPSAGDVEEASRKAEREARREQAHADHQARLAFLKTLLTKPPKEGTDYLVRVVYDGLHLTKEQTWNLAEVLGLDVPASADADTVTDLLEQYEAKGPAQLLRLVLAAQLLLEEEALYDEAAGQLGWSKYRARAEEFSAFLRDRGYPGTELPEPEPVDPEDLDEGQA